MCLVMEAIKSILCLLLIIIINVSCDKKGRIISFDSFELSSMIDGYFYYYGEYPSSLNDFLTFYNTQDSVNTTITHLLERKKDISWELKNRSVLNEELLIKDRNDTLFWFSKKKHLSYLDDLINGYEKDYLDYPVSLKDLIDYEQATKGLKEESFDRCITATLKYLQQYSDQLTWQKSDSLFLLTTGSDTISCRIGPSFGISICESDNWREKTVVLFYDKEKTVVFNKELEVSFKTGLQKIRSFYKNESFDKSDYHILQYTTSEGLQRYCNCDTLSLDTEWFTDIDAFLCMFSANFELDKIIFTSPPYRK